MVGLQMMLITFLLCVRQALQAQYMKTMRADAARVKTETLRNHCSGNTDRLGNYPAASAQEFLTQEREDRSDIKTDLLAH